MKVLDYVRSQNRNKDTKGVKCITNAGASMVDLEGRLVTDEMESPNNDQKGQLSPHCGTGAESLGCLPACLHPWKWVAVERQPESGDALPRFALTSASAAVWRLPETHPGLSFEL